SDLPAGTKMTNGNGFEPLLEAAGKGEGAVYGLMTIEQERREYRQEQRRGSEWLKRASGFGFKNVWPMFVDMRVNKTPMELRLLQHAIDISTEAHERAWAIAGEAKWEYEVDAVMAYTFKLRNADSWGYPDIVGCGPNATTLHYEESQGPVTLGALL